MKLTIESTTKIVEVNGVPARVWEGQTDSGIPVHCFITRVAVENGRVAADYSQFERELKECVPPSAALEAIPLRLII